MTPRQLHAVATIEAKTEGRRAVEVASGIALAFAKEGDRMKMMRAING
jgi:hypothetical protein